MVGGVSRRASRTGLDFSEGSESAALPILTSAVVDAVGANGVDFSEALSPTGDDEGEGSDVVWESAWQKDRQTMTMHSKAAFIKRVSLVVA
jgi:hypothetical protein